MNPHNSLIVIKKLKKFELDEGDVLHALKDSESEFCGFKEAYFSTIKHNKIKAFNILIRFFINNIL